MKAPEQVFADLMRRTPFQPATNLWRAVELDAVQQHGLPSGRGLDLGCGDGKLSAIVMDMLGSDALAATQWTGVDIDPAETAQAQACGLYEKVHTGSAADIPEADGSFDFVFSNSVLEHIGPIDEVLQEAARLLRPGGRFICTVPGPDFHACLSGPSLGRLSRADYLREVDTRCAHLRYWSEGEWRQHLGAVGLQVQTAWPYLSQRQTQRWESLSAWTGGLAYRLYGRAPRPIEIQRKWGLRSSETSLSGRLGAAATSLLAAGCPLSSKDRSESHGCLLIDAVKS